MPQNIGLPAHDYDLFSIVTHQGPVGDGKDGQPFFRHEPKGYLQWTLVYTADGAGQWEYPQWKHLTRRGEVVLMRAGAPYYCRRPAEAPLWNQNWVRFYPRPHWYSWLKWPEVAPGVMYLNVSEPRQQRRIERLMHRCVRWANQPSPRWSDYAMAAFEPVLLELNAVNPGAVEQQLDPRLVKAMEYLAAHLSDPIMLAEVAHAAGASVPVLGVWFRRQLRTSPMRYLEELRLNRAMDLLRHSTMEVKSVAELVGFESQSYFIRRFKARLQVSPHQFRRRYQGLKVSA